MLSDAASVGCTSGAEILPIQNPPPNSTTQVATIEMICHFFIGNPFYTEQSAFGNDIIIITDVVAFVNLRLRCEFLYIVQLSMIVDTYSQKI